ncbi:hypothetical protein TPHA_0C01280 [Tetrapisispora phaffii CBS 4417]|uniref:AAA+ ATPase domain-containing protein n=1 Tax=Tetrapisispora phaffii (strain ATCC 24235 / CBS 4417 / NBRC 1672 / NRRL Y-8282 / UCD 70-5) TaxID=1071381 RepID=G8BRA8_TETPH|nr:hypothetical protein TPHA_0C01280 [Tetrapisispora phaffii CBS 4417]CCE62284.1 hypothetical protein TPHA_0C01280 [Tetrapisispora phaffii CBS 4417]
MDGSNYNSILSKWSRNRKKPQPLTDLTSLYSKVANESIYYLKLEEHNDLQKALQGWKALNTDVLYQLTIIDHTYPNTQNYTKDELSLKSGVRELYHKASSHLERVQNKVNEMNKDKRSSFDARASTSQGTQTHADRSNSIKSSHSLSPASSLVKKPYVLSAPNLHNHSNNMARTLRNGKEKYHKNPIQHTSYKISAPILPRSSSPSNGNVKISKPLELQNQLYSNISNNSISSADNENEINQPILSRTNRIQSGSEKVLIDLTSESSEEENTTTDDSQNDTSFEIESYYDSYLSFEKRDIERLKTLEQLSSTEESLSKLSLNSTPLIPSNTFKQEKPLRKPLDKPKLTTTTGQVKKTIKKSNMVKEKVNKSTSVLPDKPKKITNSKLPVSTSVDSLPNKQLSVTKIKDLNKPVTSTRQKLVGKINVASARPSIPSVKSQNSPLLSSQSIAKDRSNSVDIKTVKSRSKAPRTKRLKSPINKMPKGSNTQTTSDLSKKNSSKVASPPSNIVKKNIKKNVSNESLHITEEIPDEVELTKEKLEDDIIDSLQGVDKGAAKQIFSEIVVKGDEVHWQDVIGLEAAKASLKEAVVYPFLRPDLFRGLREPVRGMLLFGPPGTGKTMIARAVATESNSTFFSISASSLTSKYLGESEKLVRALFAVAKKLAPSIIFIDEIDSIMGSRDGDGENESSRRIKNEFLVQWSSLSSAAANRDSQSDDERVLLLAATNLPWSIDEAARRRFVRRQYIPLPEDETRKAHLKKLLSHQRFEMSDEDFDNLVCLTEGFSGSDITSLAKDAAMGPLRELGEKLLDTPRDRIRAITIKDFTASLEYIKPSVSQEGLQRYAEWSTKFGSSGV